MTNKARANELLVKVLLYTHIFAWVLNMPLTQIQLFLFGRRVITLFHLGIFEFFTIVLILLLNSFQIKYNKNIKSTYLMVIFWITMWVLGFVLNPDVALYWRFYYLVYWLMPFLVIAMTVQRPIDVHSLKVFLLLIIMVHSTLIVLQHFTNALFWPFLFDDEGKQIFYISSGYYSIGKYMDRCPGVCVSGLDAGVLSIFGIVLLSSVKRMQKSLKIFLYLLFSVAIFFTGTRNVYIQLAFILAIAVIYKTPRLNATSKIRLNIFVTLLASILYFYLFNTIGGVATKNVLTDTLSAGMRVENWVRAVSQIIGSGFIRIFLGQSVWQSAGFGMLVDNMYLELIALVGIAGCIIYVAYILNTFNQVVNKSFDFSGYILSAFVLSSLVYGVANVLGNLFFTLIILSIVISQGTNGGPNSEVYQ